MNSEDKPRLVDLNSDPQPFFTLLPSDWQEELASLWPDVNGNSTLLGLELDGDLIGGGMVLRRPTPDTQAYAELAQSLFDRGLLYIAYLWISPEHRGHDYGGCWLQAVRARFAGKGFWLAIEDRGLRRFYQKHGFIVADTVTNAGCREWIMTATADQPH